MSRLYSTNEVIDLDSNDDMKDDNAQKDTPEISFWKKACKWDLSEGWSREIIPVSKAYIDICSPLIAKDENVLQLRPHARVGYLITGEKACYVLDSTPELKTKLFNIVTIIIQKSNVMVPKNIRHVFLDFSNFYFGIPPQVNKNELDFTKLLYEILNYSSSSQRTVAPSDTATMGTMIAIGSECMKPFENLLTRMGFKTSIHIQKGGKEDGVDLSLIGCILHDLIMAVPSTEHSKQKKSKDSYTFTIITGDGNNNDGFPSFKTSVDLILEKGFKVEMWSWVNSTNACYKRLCSSGQIHLFFFEDIISRCKKEGLDQPTNNNALKRKMPNEDNYTNNHNNIE
jgi:hypothetical protein